MNRRELVANGVCCGLGCLACPYEPRNLAGVRQLGRCLHQGWRPFGLPMTTDDGQVLQYRKCEDCGTCCPNRKKMTHGE